MGWGTADAVLRWHFVKAGRLGKTEKLSVRYVWMASKETDQYTTRPTSFVESDGTWLTAALGIAQKFGVVTDKVLPFKLGGQSQMYTGGANTFYALAAQRRIASYFNLGRNLAAWRNWLATKGPILTRLDVDNAFMQATATKGKLDTYTRQQRPGRPLRRPGGLRERPLHRAQQLGHRLGRQGLRPLQPTAMLSRRSLRPSAWCCRSCWRSSAAGSSRSLSQVDELTFNDMHEAEAGG